MAYGNYFHIKKIYGRKIKKLEIERRENDQSMMSKA